MSTTLSDRVAQVPPAVRDARSRAAAARRRRWLRVRLFARSLGPWIRRSIDVAAAALALIAIAPLLAVVALAIRIESRGPVFYGQERIGHRGRPFRIWKLRSMVVDADAKRRALLAAGTDTIRFKMRRDPRITRVGAVIRKLSIDELPQLWNVLVGDMTLVGPRPPIRKEVDLYDPRALRRLEVKPGLTCLWQIRGRSDLSFAQQVELDLEYIDRVRPAQEVGIVLATVPAVVTGRGAY